MIRSIGSLICDDVEGHRGGRADRDRVVQREPAAPHQSRGDRQGERDLDGREPDEPHQQRVHLGVEGLAHVGVDPLALARAEALGVDRARALGRLGDRARHRRVARALAHVARARVVQVALRRDVEQGERHQSAERGEGADDQHRDEGEGRLDDGDQPLGHGEAHGARERLDVVGRAAEQVAGAGALDLDEGERQHAREESLSQLGEDLLAERVAAPARQVGEPGEGERRPDEDRDVERHARAGEPVGGGLVDDAPDDPRRHEPGDRRETVEGEHDAELAPVVRDQRARGDANLVARGDGELAHSPSSRRTT